MIKTYDITSKKVKDHNGHKEEKHVKFYQIIFRKKPFYVLKYTAVL